MHACMCECACVHLDDEFACIGMVDCDILVVTPTHAVTLMP